MEINDIVVVTDSRTVPDKFLGSYGRVTDVAGSKVFVQFIMPVRGYGGLSHTVNISDLHKVGEAKKEE